MELFNAYEEEFKTLTKNLDQQISQAENPSQINAAERVITETQDILKQMEIEAAGIRGSEKKVATDKLNVARDQLKTLKARFSDKRFQIENKDLMGTKSGDDRLRMKNANDKLADSSELLNRALANVAEMEETANVITTELKSNTERIAATKEKTEEFNGIMDPALKTLKRMDRRRWTLGFF
eukprot:gene8204-8874_t